MRASLGGFASRIGHWGHVSLYFCRDYKKMLLLVAQLCIRPRSSNGWAGGRAGGGVGAWVRCVGVCYRACWMGYCRI